MATNSSTYRGGASVSSVQKKAQADFQKSINTRPVILQPGQTPAPKPSTAGIIKPGSGAGASVAENYRLNQITAPAKTAASSSAGLAGSVASKSRPLTDLLRVDPTNIYSPITALLEQQKTAATKRYEENAANLKNIFGVLTGLTAADQARIKEQFTQSIDASNQAYAARIAAQNGELAAGQAQAVVTGAERGQGPTSGTNPMAQATTDANAQANAYQTTWEGLQRANQAQGVADVATRGEGYTQQQVQATQDLARSLQDRLAGIGTQEAQTASDLAKTKFGIEQNIAQAKYSEAITARNNAARAAAAAAKPKSYAAGISGFASKLNDATGEPTAYTQLVGTYDAAYAAAVQKMTPGQQAKGAQPSKAQVLSTWRGLYGGNPLESSVNEYVNRYSGLK